jgi:RHS repeat-associated protein
MRFMTHAKLNAALYAMLGCSVPLMAESVYESDPKYQYLIESPCSCLPGAVEALGAKSTSCGCAESATPLTEADMRQARFGFVWGPDILNASTLTVDGNRCYRLSWCITDNDGEWKGVLRVFKRSVKRDGVVVPNWNEEGVYDPVGLSKGTIEREPQDKCCNHKDHVYKFGTTEIRRFNSGNRVHITTEDGVYRYTYGGGVQYDRPKVVTEIMPDGDMSSGSGSGSGGMTTIPSTPGATFGSPGSSRTTTTRVEQDGATVRRRETTQRFNDAGQAEWSTEIMVFYPPSHANAGKIHYRLTNEQVVKYLADHPADAFSAADPYATGGIDTADLSSYASAVNLEYAIVDGVLRPTVIKNVTSCTGCGGSSGGDGTLVKQEYVANPAFNAANADPVYRANTWKYAIRTVHLDGNGNPVGPRTVNFISADFQTIIEAKQAMDGSSVSQVWLTHHIFNARGRILETRTPSACTVYAPAIAGGWVTDPGVATSGSVGLVKMYQYGDGVTATIDDVVADRMRTGISPNPSAEFLLRSQTYVTKDQTTQHYAGFTETVRNFFPKEMFGYPTPTTQVVTSDRIPTSVVAYDWYPQTATGVGGVNRERFVSESKPAVPAAEHGTGLPSTNWVHYRLVPAATTGDMVLHYVDWERAADGSLTFHKIGTDRLAADNSYQRPIVSIVDAKTDAQGYLIDGDPALAGERAPLGPDSVQWANVNGAHMKTRYAYDGQGRTVAVLNPDGTSEITSYAVIGSGVNPIADLTLSTTVPTARPNDYSGVPVSISVVWRDGRTSVTAQGAATTNQDGNLLNDFTAGFLAGTQPLESGYIGQLNQRTDARSDVAGRILSSEQWTDPVNSAAPKLTTTYTYDPVLGWADLTTVPSGMIERPIYDGLGRVVGQQVGRSVAGLVTVREMVYDNGGVGNGLVTEQRARFGAGANEALVTRIGYDAQDRPVRSLDPQQILAVTTYDWMGRMLASERYAGVADIAAPVVATALRSRTTQAVDARGRVWKSSAYAVDPVTGAVGNAQVTRMWFDSMDRVVRTRQPGGALQKTGFDGLGRTIWEATTVDDAEVANHAGIAMADLTNDQVVEETRRVYDPHGRIVTTVAYARMPGATRLGSLADGFDPAQARRRIQAMWYDDWSRTAFEANYGTGDGATSFTRPATPPAAGGTEAQVSAIVYDAFGRERAHFDNLNRQRRHVFDALDRQVRQIDNYVDGVATIGEVDTDRVAEWLYDAGGRLATLRAINTTTTALVNQETKSVYADPVDPERVTATIYPDSQTQLTQIDGAWSVVFGADHVAKTFDRLGRVTFSRDQRGVEHAYVYDTAGRMVADVVTVLPANVDGRVRRLGYGFDDQGRPTTATSYADTAGTIILNQNVTAFGPWGDISSVSQNHDGAVVPGSPTITYGTTEQVGQNGESGAVRRTSMTYPSANRTVYHHFGTAGSIDDRLSRMVAQAADAAGNTKFTAHEYLGIGRVVSVAHPQISGGLTYTLSHATALDGLDRFDRSADLGWKRNDGTYVDRFQYGYDVADRRTWKRIAVTGAPASLNDFITYDRNDRPVTYDRGSLVGTAPNYSGVSSPSFAETWSNDALGNDRVYSRNDGASSFAQTKAFNTFNEIDVDDLDANSSSGSIIGTSGVGGNWVSPSYDATGNITRLPMLGSEASVSQARLLTWDAWNRLAYAYVDVNGNALVDGADLTAGLYFYDAAHRRIAKTTQVAIGSWQRDDFYLNDNWQVVEARKVAGEFPLAFSGSSAQLHNLWGVRYIDCLAMQWRDTDGNGSMDSSFSTTSDASFSVTSVVSGNGLVAERSLYDIHGIKTVLNASFASTVHLPDMPTIGFTGRESDAETGLQHFRARMYCSSLGNFVSRDPAEYVSGYNVYLSYFVPNSVDPSGLIPLDTIWDLGNIVYDIAVGDYVGLAADVAALAVPYVPAGATKFISPITKGIAKIEKVEELAVKGVVGAAKHVVSKGPDIGKALNRLSVTYEYVGRAANAAGSIHAKHFRGGKSWILNAGKLKSGQWKHGTTDEDVKKYITLALKELQKKKASGQVTPQDIDNFVFDVPASEIGGDSHPGILGAADVKGVGRCTNRIKLKINVDGKNLHAFPFIK